jgi:hypothetical protein
MQTKALQVKNPVRAIVMFGPPTDHSGMRPAEYFQVTIDPNMASPSGEFIRFDQTIQKGEMHGWQRLECITICEILGAAEPYEVIPDGYELDENAELTMAIIDHG